MSNLNDNDVQITSEMPESFDDREFMLERLIQSGIEKLLHYSRKNNLLKPPFGRPPQPTPLITEEEFMKSELWKDPNANTEPKFEYNYGFNALRYLADYIKWAHPESVQQREKERQDAMKKLQEIANYAQYRDKIQDELVLKAISLQSGILWGPYTSSITPSTVHMICQPMKPGQVHIEVALDSSYNQIIFQNDFYHDPYEFEDDTQQDYPIDFVPFKTIIDTLSPGLRYYIRCRTIFSSNSDVNDDHESSSPSVTYSYNESSFWTSPSEYSTVKETTDANLIHSFDSVTLIGLGIGSRLGLGSKSESQLQSQSQSQYYSMLSSVLKLPGSNVIDDLLQSQTSITCILGDPLSVQTTNHLSSTLGNRYNHSKSIYYEFYKTMETYMSPISDKTSLLMAWNDTRPGSDKDLMYEEYLYHNYRHDMKKYDKKYKKASKKFGSRLKLAEMPPPPVLQRPPLSHSLNALSEGFPVKYAEDSTISMYRSFPLGPDIQIFLLDTRCGYLGKHQSKWLKKGLSKSTATWKIILSGTTYGVDVIPLSVEHLEASNQGNNQDHNQKIEETKEHALQSSFTSSSTEEKEEERNNSMKKDETNSSVRSPKESNSNSSNANTTRSAIIPSSLSLSRPRTPDPYGMGLIQPDGKIYEDEVDENGVSKTSLQYILSYLQSRNAVDTDDDKSSIGGEDSLTNDPGNSNGTGNVDGNNDSLISISHDNNSHTDIPMSSTSLVDHNISSFLVPTSITSENGFESIESTTPENNGIPRNTIEGNSNSISEVLGVTSTSTEEMIRQDNAIGRVRIQSGIILMTGGSLIPYIATYDPNDMGRPHVVEVNGGISIASQEMLLQTTIDSNIMKCYELNSKHSSIPTYLFNPASGRDGIAQPMASDTIYWNSLTLQSDGSMRVNIYSKKIIIENKFDSPIPEDDLRRSNNDSLECSIVLTTNVNLF